MTRRDVLVLGAGLGMVGSGGLAAAGMPGESRVPAGLKVGARVALIAPASASSSPEEVDGAIESVKGWGFEPVLGPSALMQEGYFAGSDTNRASDLKWAFEDESIEGIIAIRGGYGCARILSRLDFGLIKRHPKVLMGYSDLTALLVAITQETGLATFHGPVGSSSSSEFATNWMHNVIREGFVGELECPTTDDPDFALRTVVGGVGEGRLLGGNLSVLASVCGSKWQMKGEGAIMFLEDIGEAPYRIDRMLTQLILANCFKGCKGVLVGQFTGCDAKAPDSPWKVSDVVIDRLSGLGIPVLAGCPIGHVKDKWTLPLGVRAKVDADRKTVELLEPGVRV